MNNMQPFLLFITFGKLRFYIRYVFSMVNRLIYHKSFFFSYVSDAFEHFVKPFSTYVQYFFFIDTISILRYISAFRRTFIFFFYIYIFFPIVVSSNLRCLTAVTRKINDECKYDIVRSLMNEFTNNNEDKNILACK